MTQTPHTDQARARAQASTSSAEEDLLKALEEPLNAELRELQRQGIGVGLRRVSWAAGWQLVPDGELHDDEVVVYVTDEASARRTVRRMAYQKSLRDLIMPYQHVISALLKDLDERTFDRIGGITAAAASQTDHGAA